MAQHLLISAVDKSWKQINGAWKKVRAKASEKSVHDLRVSTRRMIAVLDLIGAVSGDDRLTPVRKRFKKVIKRMGDLRDVQVQMENLSQLRSIEPIKTFQRSLKRRERDAIDDVGSSLRRRAKRRLSDDMDSVRSCLGRFQKASDDKTVYRNIDALVTKRHKEFWTARNHFKPEDEESLHEVRIALKKLRYVVEAAEPVLGRWAKQRAHQMQAAQQLMGDTRDMEILRARLEKWADKKGRKVADLIAPQLARLDDKRSRLANSIRKSTAQFQHLSPARRHGKPRLKRESVVAARLAEHAPAFETTTSAQKS